MDNTTGTDAGNGLTYQVGYSPSAVTAMVTAARPPRAYTKGVAVSPDGSQVYLTGAATRLLRVIGPATGQVKATITVGRSTGVAAS